MEHVYKFFSKTLLIAASIAVFNYSHAQSPTTTSHSGVCNEVKENFNSSSGGHSSPSIYDGDIFHKAFYYDSTQLLWSEMTTANANTPQSANRTISIVSPPYSNPNPPTIFDIGFWAQTSSPTDQFQVRIIAIKPGPDGTTETDVVASSDIQTFSDWGTFTFVADPVHPVNSGYQGNVCIRLIDQDITNENGTFYRVEIAYIESGTTFAAYDNLSIGPLTGQGSLPVNFIGIVGNRNTDNSVSVRWDVGDELNVRNYQLERSTDANSFTTVGTVMANHKTVYGYTDMEAKAAILYYRVKSVDNDGQFRYSGIIKVVNNNSFSNAIKVYPSPAQSQITVQHSQLSSTAKFTVTTMDGRVVKAVQPSTGASNTMVDISTLSAGMYILRLDHGNGKIETTTFVKQ